MDMLDALAKRMNCICLSDLHFCQGPSLLSALEAFRDKGYPLSDWSETVRYVTGAKESFGSIDEALRCMKEWSRRH